MKGEGAGENTGTPDRGLGKGRLGNCWQEKQKGRSTVLRRATLQVKVHRLSKKYIGFVVLCWNVLRSSQII